MVRSIGAQLGLLAFALAIVAGLYAGNSPVTILLRALIVMVAASLVGQSLGWAANLILRDHLQKKKLALDQQHAAAVRAINSPPEPTVAADDPSAGRTEPQEEIVESSASPLPRGQVPAYAGTGARGQPEGLTQAAADPRVGRGEAG